MGTGYAQLKNELVSAANGVGCAYRDTGGEGEVPLVSAVQLDAAVGDPVAQLGVPPLDHGRLV